ncbi:hypothetical protein ONZ45_g6357 [Pleurotus djamor]|nr:hypothetical protein ONZ45_g6357 [Pleurotus djamor]
MAVADPPLDLVHNIVEYLANDQATLCTLVRTAQHFRHQVQPALYRNVRFRSGSEPHVKLVPKLEQFCSAIRQSDRLSSAVRCLDVVFLGGVIPDDVVDLVDLILRCSRRLRTFMFVSHAHRLVFLPTLRDNPTSLSLTRFTFDQHIGDPSLLSRFLETQEALEHLELPALYASLNLSAKALPRLRILKAQSTVVLELLMGRNITHLHYMQPVWRFRDTNLTEAQLASFRSVMSLSISEYRYDTSNFMAHMPYLQYLDIQFLRMASISESLLAYVQESQGLQRICCIRVRTSKGQFVPKREPKCQCVPLLFDRLPSLVWVDFLVNGADTYDRAYRDAELSVLLPTSSEINEAWWYDHTTG